MANRYWVGGAGTWNTTSTTNWSASSGGASGASVPTAADSVFFDQAGTYTVTCTGALTCLDLTVSAGTVTFVSGTSPTFAISGSMSLVAGTVWNSTGTITFNATTTGKTITTNGTSIGGAITFNGVGGGWTLGSALTLANFSEITVTNGTFDTSSTGNYSVLAGGFNSSNINTRTINFNASTITISLLTFTVSGVNLTFNAGTSSIVFSYSQISFNGGGNTFYNVSCTSPTISLFSISSANIFNNLTLTGRISPGVNAISLSANQTINGTLTLNSGTASAYRTFIYSSSIGTQRTLTCAAISGGTDYDFRDIAIAGAASPISPTRAGDCKNNSGITFPAAKTVYFARTVSSNWGGTTTSSWSFTSGGLADLTAFPLAQDTAVFPAATYPASGSTTTINANYNIGTINMSLRTSNTMILATGTTTPTIYGNLINGTGITNTASTGSAFIFAGRTTQQITSAGRSFAQDITVNSPSGTVQLQDAFTTGTARTTTLTQGTLDLQSYTLSTGLFNSNVSGVRAIAFDTGNITCTGTGIVYNNNSPTNFSTSGTQVINITSTGSTAITVNSGAYSEADSISFNFTGGTYALTFLQSVGQVARNVDFTGYAGTWGATSTVTVFGNLKLSTGMTLTASASILSFKGTSGTQQITTNGKTLDFPLTFNGVGGTFRLEDALTMGSTRTATLNNGTLDLNGKTMTVGTRFTIVAGTKNLTFNGGTLVCPDANTTSFYNASLTGFTTTAGTGTGTISMTAATAKTFVGGGSTYNCTLNQGGAGTLTISGSNTFLNITDTVQPATVLFTAGTTNIFTSFSLSGTAGNLITLGSTTTSQATLQKGSTWYMGANSTNGGNNTGLTFTAGDGIDYLSVSYINGTVVAPPSGVTGQFLMFF